MKKVLKTILVLFSALVLTAGILIIDRYRKNPPQLFPYPYSFQESAMAMTPEAPILIVGDRMADHFSKFKVDLAQVISRNLSKPIKIESMARPTYGLHRTLHELHSLTQWPPIVIYQGGSEEFLEMKFNYSEVPIIKENFKRYSDDRIATAITLWPWLSRIIYEPMNRVILEGRPSITEEISEQDYLRRLDTELLLFEQQLLQLINLTKDRNSLLVLMTTPLNLDAPPRRNCSFTVTSDIEKEILELEELLKDKNYKVAYSKSARMVEQYAGNAQLFFLHGQIAKGLGKASEGKKYLLKATAFDCRPWRATEVHNSIIRKLAKDHQVVLFDFARFVESEWADTTTFFDEIYAQNLYYERGTEQLGLVIKEILKL